MANKKHRQRNQKLIVAGVVAVLAVGASVAVVSVLREQPAAESVAAESIAKESAADQPLGNPVAAEFSLATADSLAESPLIDDDGRTIWASPTAGEPLTLDYLPPDCQLVLHLRPQELLADEQAARAVRSLGPSGERLWLAAEQAVGCPLDKLTSITIGVRAGAGDALEATLVVEPAAGLAPGPPSGGRTAEHNGATYQTAGGWCYFEIEGDPRGRYVTALRPALHEILDAGGDVPPMRREMEQLVAASDASRHVSLLVAPSFLFTDGKAMFVGDTAALRPALFDQLTDDLLGVLASLHWADGRFYWELKVAPAADTRPLRLAHRLGERARDWPSEVQLAVLDASPAPHGRRVVAQLPLMLGVAAKYARTGVEQRHAVVNGYLPTAAGHNLLLAAELLLAQQSVGAIEGVATTTTTTQPPRTVAEKLRQPVSVAFARDTLEMAVRFLADEMQTPIVILGSDLQLEGITKNQSFGLDAQRQPAEQVLLEILTRANPDKTAAGPSDDKQKLVYVVRQQPGGADTIYITTRAAAAKRAEPLPAIFLPPTRKRR